MKKYPVIDMHTHLRNDILMHTRIASESGIYLVVYMANCVPPLDNLDAIKKSLEEERYGNVIAMPVSAITKGLEGKELVDIGRINPHVLGFSDDGRCVYDLGIVKEILQSGSLVLAHCEPETEMIENYLDLLSDVGGRLHIQHISRKESVDLIREAKKSLSSDIFTCETCPHYFTFTEHQLAVDVYPPLGKMEDVKAIREGLYDGTIDVIASDYAPPPRPRGTGIAGFSFFLPLCYGLVKQGILTEEQLRQKIYDNPKRIIERSGVWLYFGDY